MATINYRRSPAAKQPAHAIDVKRAVAWVRGAQHAFDLVHSIRTEFAVDAVHRFLEVC